MKSRIKELFGKLLLVSILLCPILDISFGFINISPDFGNRYINQQIISAETLTGQEELEEFYQREISSTLPDGNSWETAFNFSNLHFDRGFDFLNISSTFLRFDNCFFSLGRFSFYNSSNIQILNSKGENSEIIFSLTNNIYLENNIFKGPTSKIIAEECRNITIENNIFLKTQKTYSIEFDFVENGIFSNNLILNSKSGLKIGYSENIIVTTNKFQNLDYVGTHLHSGDNISLIDNQYINCQQVAIWIEHETLNLISTGNQVKQSNLLLILAVLHYTVFGLGFLWGYGWVCELAKQQKKSRYHSLSLKLPELFGGDGLISKKMGDDSSLEVCEDTSSLLDDSLKEESTDILIFRPWWERFFQILAIILWTSFLIIEIYLAFVPNFGVAYSPGIFPIRVDVIILLGILTIVGVTNLTVLEYKTQWLTYMAFSGNEGVRTLDIEEIFQNHNRKTILGLILNRPYLYFSEIQRITEFLPGNLQYHLNVLLDAKIIKKQEVGQLSLYFSYLKKNIFDSINLKIMKSESTLQIYHCINQNPGITMSDISRNLDKHKSTISYHVQKLVENKIVREEKHGRKKKLFLERDIFLNEP